jgi:glucose-fructose oxidoreductase
LQSEPDEQRGGQRSGLVGAVKRLLGTDDQDRKVVRYAVVGLGHIAQNAVLPAFASARENSRLTALISDDPTKRRELAQRYRLSQIYSYDQYDEALRSGAFDAVYIALPNNMHADFTVRAAQAGIHVLCEKPMAVSCEECEAMIDAATQARIKLMVAYRLHFEAANLRTVELVQSGELGALRTVHAVFTMQVRPGNIRLRRHLGGGPLLDLGIYCINAARYVFRAEPTAVMAMAARGNDSRFREVEEGVVALLRYPDERLATIACGFGSADVSQYQVVGTRGHLRVDPAFEYQSGLRSYLTIDERTRTERFRRRDQFAPQLIYFSRCILENREPEPSAREGCSDVRIMEAIYGSARTGRQVELNGLRPESPPTPRQEIHKRPPRKARLVHAESASLH